MSFRCPIGVGKAQEAPIATAIGKLSASTPSAAALPRAIGHITAAVAALFMTSHWNTVITSASATTACPCAR